MHCPAQTEEFIENSDIRALSRDWLLEELRLVLTSCNLSLNKQVPAERIHSLIMRKLCNEHLHSEHLFSFYLQIHMLNKDCEAVNCVNI